MYKIYFNNKSKEVIEKEGLNEDEAILLVQDFLKEDELADRQDIICVIGLDEKVLALMGHKESDKINIINATTTAIIA